MSAENKTFHVFYGWLDPDVPKDAEILNKIKTDVKAAQDLAEAHRKIDAEAEEKRRALHAETEAKKSALGISSGPTDYTTPFVPQPIGQTHGDRDAVPGGFIEGKPVISGADLKQVVVPVPLTPVPLVTTGKKGSL